MAASGMRFEKCDGMLIDGADLRGLDTGIDLVDCKDVTINDAHFEHVNTGIKARKVNRLNVSNSIDTKYASFELTMPARLVAWYINELRRKY